MADLTITAANVATVSGTVRHGIAGGTVTQGMPVRVSSGELIAAADTSIAAAAVAGIALGAASDGQPLAYQDSGVINLGATLVIGTVYVLSASGKIAPIDDVAIADNVTVIGVAITAANLKLGIIVSGVAAAAAVA